jgi:hypothetical protein
MPYGESPLAQSVDLRWHDRIVHATLDIDGVELAGTSSQGQRNPSEVTL